MRPTLICTDLEGVFIPEIWIAVAEATGLAELRLTTRDVKDYDELMAHRLKILARENLTLPRIQQVIQSMPLLDGAEVFLKGLRAAYPLAILSDTFYGFAGPFMARLGWPMLLCHTLVTDAEGRITGYTLRSRESKKNAVASFQQQGYRVIAFGDSYNDTHMLAEADAGFLFHAPAQVKTDFPQYAAFEDYADLASAVHAAAGAPTYF